MNGKQSRAVKARGRAFENDVARYLTGALGVTVERNGVTYGRADRGDLRGVAGWTLEVKNEQRIDLAGYMREAQTEAEHNGTPLYAAVVKARRKATDEAYVVMPLRVFARAEAEPD